jgi:hypothetical protein
LQGSDGTTTPNTGSAVQKISVVGVERLDVRREVGVEGNVKASRDHLGAMLARRSDVDENRGVV